MARAARSGCNFAAMTISLDSIPRFTAAQALTIAHQRYGIEGRVTVLPSERDQNFLIVDARGAKFVLKVANRDDAPALLEFQHQAMRRVAAARCSISVIWFIRPPSATWPLHSLTRCSTRRNRWAPPPQSFTPTIGTIR